LVLPTVLVVLPLEEKEVDEKEATEEDRAAILGGLGFKSD
jgi:hypothetical protein